MWEFLNNNPERVAQAITFLINSGILIAVLNLLPRKVSRAITEVFNLIVDVATKVKNKQDK